MFYYYANFLLTALRHHLSIFYSSPMRLTSWRDKDYNRRPLAEEHHNHILRQVVCHKLVVGQNMGWVGAAVVRRDADHSLLQL